MNNIFRILHRSKAGFTMIEILVVVGILGVLAAVIIPNIMGLMNEGEEEAKNTEHHNIQVAVYSMMVKAEVQRLDGSSDYDGIDELAEIHGVTVTNPDTSTTYYLDDYLYSGKYPLKQAYDIALDGSVTVD
ncbi:type II secretion system protein [Chloroflexota bacterium]